MIKKTSKVFPKKMRTDAFEVVTINKTKIIKLKPAEYLGSGCFGAFYDLKNGFGVKVFHHRYDTVAEAKRNLKIANSEFKVLKKARRKFGDTAPEPDSLQIIQIFSGGLWRFAVGMSVETINRAPGPLSYMEKDLLKSYLMLKIAELGLYWDDAHDGNWFVTSDLNRVVIVDWGLMQKSPTARLKKSLKQNIKEYMSRSEGVRSEIKQLIEQRHKVA